MRISHLKSEPSAQIMPVRAAARRLLGDTKPNERDFLEEVLILSSALKDEEELPRKANLI